MAEEKRPRPHYLKPVEEGGKEVCFVAHKIDWFICPRHGGLTIRMHDTEGNVRAVAMMGREPSVQFLVGMAADLEEYMLASSRAIFNEAGHA